MKNVLSIISIALLVCGCAAMKPKTIGGPEDYGKYPDHYQQIVTNYIQMTFRDPDSVKDLSISPPIKHLTKESLGIYGSNKTYGYLIGFFCNAKNGFGGYTGTQAHVLFVRDDQILSGF